MRSSRIIRSWSSNTGVTLLEPELSLHDTQPTPNGRIVAVSDQVAGFRVGDPAARKAIVMVAEAALQNLGVFTPGRGQMLQDERPELAVRDAVPDSEVVAGRQVPDKFMLRRSGNPEIGARERAFSIGSFAEWEGGSALDGFKSNAPGDSRCGPVSCPPCERAKG